MIDLEQLNRVPSDKAGPLARYAAAIQTQRGDYNGRVLSIRADDLRTLAVIYDQPAGLLAEELIAGCFEPEGAYRCRPSGCATDEGGEPPAEERVQSNSRPSNTAVD